MRRAAMLHAAGSLDGNIGWLLSGEISYWNGEMTAERNLRLSSQKALTSRQSSSVNAGELEREVGLEMIRGGL